MRENQIMHTAHANLLTEEIVRKAILGASIATDPELLVEYRGRVPQEYVDAAKLIQDNYEQFRQFVWKRLEQIPLTKKYFGKLIRIRLKQKGILSSPIISVIFNDYQTLEQRLSNVKSVTNIESLRKEYGGNEDFLQGAETDSVMQNMLAEILALDFLIKLGFANICKISRKDKPHIDIFAEKDGQSYSIDATRKHEVRGWEVNDDTGLEDCNSEQNLLEIRRLIIQALDDKDEQFCRALDAHTISDTSVKVIAIKTSDYGFAECIGQAAEIAQDLFSEEDRWEYVDCVWFLPNTDVSQSFWVFKKVAG